MFYTDPMIPKGTTIHQRFQQYDGARRTLLDRAVDMTALVLPRLMQSDDGVPGPPGSQEHLDMDENYWGKPAQNISNLTAKIGQAVFPPNGVPFFEFSLDTKTIDALAQSGQINPAIAEDLPIMAKGLENQLLDVLQTSNYRDTLYSAIEQIICLPNTLVYQSDEHEFRTYRLDQFIIRRTIDGAVAEIITRDWVEPDMLPEELQGIKAGSSSYTVGRVEPYYTQILWNTKDKRWDVTREFREVKVEENKSYDKDLLPYYDLQWSSSVGETYGTSLVETNWPLIRSGESVARSLAEGLAAGSEGRFGVDPTGITNISDLEDTANWSFVAAREADVFALQANVGASVAVALETLRMYSEQLDQAFMTNAAAQLRGERVTAYQVNKVENQVEEGLGSPLNQVARQIQRRVVLRTLHVETKKGKIPGFWQDLLKAGGMTLKVKTGLDALGRQLDSARIEGVLSVFYQTQDPELMMVLNKQRMAQDYVASSGLDPARYVRSTEELNQMRQAQQQQALQAMAAEQAVSTAGSIAEQRAAQG